MRLLLKVLIVVALVYGSYHAIHAGYGYFQMQNVVNNVTTRELNSIVSRAMEMTFGIEFNERLDRIRAGIMKGARIMDVDLRPEDIVIEPHEGYLRVKVSWMAPIVVYNGKTYLEIPLSLDRNYDIRPNPAAAPTS